MKHQQRVRVYLKWRLTNQASLNTNLHYEHFHAFQLLISSFLLSIFFAEFLSHRVVEAATFSAEVYHPHHVQCATTWYQTFLARPIWKMATVNICTKLNNIILVSFVYLFEFVDISISETAYLFYWLKCRTILFLSYMLLFEWVNDRWFLHLYITTFLNLNSIVSSNKNCVLFFISVSFFFCDSFFTPSKFRDIDINSTTTADRQGSYRYFFIGILIAFAFKTHNIKIKYTANDVLMSHTKILIITHTKTEIKFTLTRAFWTPFKPNS